MVRDAAKAGRVMICLLDSDSDSEREILGWEAWLTEIIFLQLRAPYSSKYTGE
jgi:hypothetical protein